MELLKNSMLFRLVFVLILLLLSACGERPEIGGMAVPEAPPRQADAAQLAMGEQVFTTHCAKCHGERAQGAANWRKADADGNYPPPPLDGSGHAWHHSREVLKGMIRDGSPQGEGNMPAWKGRLSEEQIDAAIAWFQSIWPKPVYDAWFEMQQRGR